MPDYDYILNMISLLLALIILFIILFGCKCNTRHVRENFENKKEEEKEKEKKLSDFESKVLEGLMSGSVTSPDLESLIKNEQFTEKNLENLI
jgi:flagellar biosynthesis/type III secretory pathway M-ring protein FliF/YscJ